MSNLSDMMDRAKATGNWEPLIGVTMEARAEAEEGHYCECSDPQVTGLDLMCADCLLEVESQHEARQKAHDAPHAYVRMAGGRDFGMCDFCTRWEDDPIHQQPESLQ